jgi:hypothetical protein
VASQGAQQSCVVAADSPVLWVKLRQQVAAGAGAGCLGDAQQRSQDVKDCQPRSG